MSIGYAYKSWRVVLSTLVLGLVVTAWNRGEWW